jgi:hypothetical protein
MHQELMDLSARMSVDAASAFSSRRLAASGTSGVLIYGVLTQRTWN